MSLWKKEMTDDASKATNRPKVFVSYSWSSDDYQQWVHDFCHQLHTHSGVEVVVDLWSLKPGYDTYTFMEQAVTDESITHVLCLCDQAYYSKAIRRQGGVGAESMIISPELYKKATQEKVIPIVMEKKENGEPYLPPFMNGRFYIDLSSREFGFEFEQLLRHLFNQPLYKRPELGKPPRYLFDEQTHSTLGTEHAFDRLQQQSQTNNRAGVAAATDYLDAVLAFLSSSEVDASNGKPIYKQVEQKIAEMKPLRDQFLQFLKLLVRRYEPPQYQKKLHVFFEAILKITNKDVRHETHLDHIRFFLHELFLHTAAYLIKENQLETLNHLVITPYISRTSNGVLREFGFTELQQHLHSLDKEKKERENLNRISVTSDLLKARSDDGPVNIEDLATADVTLMLRAIFDSSGIERWYTYIAPWLRHEPLTFYFRGTNDNHFKSIAAILGVESREDLKSKFQHFKDRIDNCSLSWQWRCGYAQMISLERIAG